MIEAHENIDKTVKRTSRVTHLMHSALRKLVNIPGGAVCPNLQLEKLGKPLNRGASEEKKLVNAAKCAKITDLFKPSAATDDDVMMYVKVVSLG